MRLPPRDSALRGRRVAVAGAGLAGLAAAWALERRGADVRVFEARHRVGGRVLTVRSLPGAAHAEAGGDLIEKDDCRAIRALAGAMGLALTRVLPGGFRYYTGSPGRRGRMRAGSEMFDVLRERLRPEIDAFTRAGQSLTSGMARALAGRTALEWARTVRGPREAIAATEALRGFFLADPSKYSLLMLVQQLSEEGDPASTTSYRIAGGNSRLPEALAREIAFRPRLPDAQQRVIATLPYGRATKALVSFDRRFWRLRGRAFGSRMPSGAAWESGTKRSAGTLALLAGGETSDALKTLVALPLLAAPAGRIAFAGEHTSSESQGYMEGAAMSGLRAADDIVAALR